MPRGCSALWYHLLPLFFFLFFFRTICGDIVCTPCLEQTTNPRHVFSVSLFPCLSGTCWRCTAAPGHFPFDTECLGSPAEMATTHYLHGHPKTFGTISGAGTPSLYRNFLLGAVWPTRAGLWRAALGPARDVATVLGSRHRLFAERRSSRGQLRGRLPELWPERGAGVWAGPKEGAALAGSEPVRAAPVPRPLARERRGRALRQSLAVPSALTGSAEIAAGPVLPPPWPRSLRTEVARAATAAAASGAAFSP